MEKNKAKEKDADSEIGKREAGTKLGEKRVKVLFCNVQGLRKKESDFWDYVGKFDVMGLVETWVQRENCEKFEETYQKNMCGSVKRRERKRKRGEQAGEE